MTHIIRRRGWEIAERFVTPEHLVMRRRGMLAGAAALATLPVAANAADETAPKNPKYTAGRPLSEEKDATTYNNYYEFSESKNLWRKAQALKQRPWQIQLEGMVQKPRTIDIDDLLKQVTLEERIYRHRCVEAWAMTVPWTGFPLSQLVKLADPLSGAKYVTFQTIQDPKTMPGLNSPFYPWPYVEAVTMDEAMNDVAFISTGLFGKPLPPQNGGPIRLTLPWKYGFKSAKAIVKVGFTDKRPPTFWAEINPGEYGFWANVNPQVAHPRWSQAHERLLGSDEMVPTQLYNGYAEFVADLYTDRKNEKLFIVIAHRILAVLSAVLLVGSVALATVGPRMISLGRLVYQIDRDLPDALRVWLQRTPGRLVWTDIMLPLLQRPAWLLPASVGLICAGLSLSLSSRKATHRSHRRS